MLAIEGERFGFKMRRMFASVSSAKPQIRCQRDCLSLDVGRRERILSVGALRASVSGRCTLAMDGRATNGSS